MFAVHLGWFKKPAALVVLLSLHLLNTVVLGFLLFHGSYTLAGHFFMCQIRLRLKKERKKMQIGHLHGAKVGLADVLTKTW